MPLILPDGIKISQLPTLPGNFNGNELFPFSRDGTTWKRTFGDMLSYFLTTESINRVPHAQDFNVSAIDTDQQLSGNILVGASDPDGDPLVLQTFSYNGTSQVLASGSFQTALGVMFLNIATGDWVFTEGQGARALNVGDVGHEIFTYTIADGRGGLVTKTLTISITGTNSVPVVNSVNDQTPINVTVTGNLIAHYAFDYESAITVVHYKIAGDSTTYVAGSTTSISGKGTITIGSNGDYTFVPVADFFGPVPVITYTLQDVGSPPNQVDAFLTLAVNQLAPGVSPIILHTNNPSGPVSGGEHGDGCFLTIVGLRLGTTSGLGTTTKVYIGSVEVAHYFPIQDAALAPKINGLQALTVQVANMDSSALGVPQPVTVVVSGNTSNADWHFTPNPGNFYYLSQSGSDTTGTANDITKPFRTLQKPNRTDPAIWPNLRAGDHVIVRQGNWNDLGYDTAWGRFRDPQQMGSNPTGVSGTGWICFMPYPGETVAYETPSGGNKGGFQGPGQAFAGTTGEWVAVSNFFMSNSPGSARDAGFINMQYSTGHWRVTNMSLGPWPAGDSPVLNAAALTGAGNFVDLLGNYIHDIEGTSAQQNHGLYAGTLSYGWRIGYSWFKNCIGGSHIQFNDSDGGTGTQETPFGIWEGFTNIQVFNNFLEVSAKYGINFADVGANTGDLSFRAWNNQIIGTGLAPVRLNTTTTTSDVTVAFNTMYDCFRTASGSGQGYIRNEGFQQSPGHVVRVYDNILAFGPNTVAGAQWFTDYNGGGSGVVFSRNLYFANGQSPTAPIDTLAVTGDPKFTSASTGDLSLLSSSPAINAATQALPSGFSVGNDITGQASRLFGGAPDLGCYEYGQTTPFLTSAPTATTGTQVGVVNSCTLGTWGNSPTSYSRQAYVDGVAKGSAITGTGTASYTPVAGDADGVLTWGVTATNSSGSTTYTITVGTVAAGAGHPVNTVPPAISGTQQAGNVLTTTDGTWTGTVDSYSYQWLRDDVAIGGATSSTYTLVTADVGHIIKSKVRAHNSTTGAISATSSGTSAILPAAADPVYVQNVTGTTPASSNGTFTLPSSVSTGNLLIGWYVSWDQSPDNFAKSDNEGHTSSDFSVGARISPSSGSDNPHGQYMYLKANANGTYTLTLNQGGGQQGSGVLIEVGGLDPSSTFDIPQDHNDSAGTAGTAITLSATAATTKPNDLLLVGVGWTGTGKTITLPDSTWVEVAHIDGAFSGCALFRRKITSIETFSFAATLDSASHWVAQSMVVKGS